jgi:hypothetical protein
MSSCRTPFTPIPKPHFMNIGNFIPRFWVENGGLTACADDSCDVDVGKSVGELVHVHDAVAGDLLPVRLPLQSVHRVRTSTKHKENLSQAISCKLFARRNLLRT